MGFTVRKRLEAVKLAVQLGNKVNAKNRLGWTPLMVAGGIYIANGKKAFATAAN